MTLNDNNSVNRHHNLTLNIGNSNLFADNSGGISGNYPNYKGISPIRKHQPGN